MLSDLELLTLQTETLFVQNEAKRLLYTNEPDKPEAPRFFLGRTNQGHLCRFRNDLPEKLCQELAELAGETEVWRLDEPGNLQPFQSILRQHGPIQSVESGPAYRFPVQVYAAPNVVTITAANADLLEKHFAELKAVLEYKQPCVAVVEGSAVSVCCSARTSSQAVEAGLETVPTARGQGYAAQVVKGWAAAVTKSGRIPLYSTSWENGASRVVAKKLGLIIYATDLHFT